jgi:hypothetical protein
LLLLFFFFFFLGGGGKLGQRPGFKSHLYQ